MKTQPIPKYVIVAAAGEFKPGLVVKIQFGMIQKNDFLYIDFIYRRPITLKKAMLIERFDQIRNLFPADYAEPEQAFNGNITVEVLTVAEIRSAIKHYRANAKSIKFPPGYLKGLEAALNINAKSDCLVACEKLY